MRLVALIVCSLTLTSLITQPCSAQWGWSGGYYHASTAQEGEARGMADVIRSQGQANLLNSAALGNIEDARSKNIENRVQATEAYYQRKQIRQDYLEDKENKDRYALQQSLDRRRVKPLTSQQFDPSTGQITWPGLLRMSEYAKYREPLDELFTKQAQSGSVSHDEYVAALQASKSLRAQLKKDRGEYPAKVLSQAIRFVLKLNHEMDHLLG